jgi:hypothetical protein
MKNDTALTLATMLQNIAAALGKLGSNQSWSHTPYIPTGL